MKTKAEIVAIINLAMDAVESSNCAPLILKKSEDDDGSMLISSLAFGVFTEVLRSLLPHHMTSDMNATMTSPKEPWQE